ncbi:uncharacterized protein Dwil_GK22371 [Drosophila willistoni]|uniref:Citrate transporter-like domain-containing protein n=1 Tax=Drosophila willistoni TaxID=7260 RepID=B4NGB8_DROWI|nr:protein I'm not dead yet 2 [Drosophila willistoni]EDW83335.2 uncharacterized protein Dwil_GK22371 [Drosophila willistoni]
MDGDNGTVKERIVSCCKFHWRGKLICIFPLLVLPMLLYGYLNDSPEFVCLYVVVVMALFWITELLPLYVTALIPVVALPLFGVLSSKDLCVLYFSDTVILFLGGLIIALAIEYCNLHQRIALRTMLIVGTSPRLLHFGLMSVTAFISLWISNSAGAAMMCPIIKAVLNEMDTGNIFNVYMSQEEEPYEEGDPPHPSHIAMAFYIGVAYAASIGGCGTLIGTGTNLVFKGLYDTRFPDSVEKVSFPVFMLYSCPLIVGLNLLLTYLSLQITHMGLFRWKSKRAQEVKKGSESKELIKAVLKSRHASLGPMSCHEIQVTILFVTTIVLLFTCKPGFMPGWANFLNAKKIGNSPCILLPAVLMFALPTQYTFFKYCCGKPPFPGRAMDALISWTYLQKHMPWGLCFLLGGGFALAQATRVSGVNTFIGRVLSFCEGSPEIVVVMLCVFVSIFCTTFSSNVVVANILLPIFFELALILEMHPLVLAYPSCLATSMAYLLPVSTPPNAIVAAYGNIKTKYLILAALLPSACAFFVVVFNAYTWGHVVYPTTGSFPDWAAEAKNQTTRLVFHSEFIM